MQLKIESFFFETISPKLTRKECFLQLIKYTCFIYALQCIYKQEIIQTKLYTRYFIICKLSFLRQLLIADLQHISKIISVP